MTDATKIVASSFKAATRAMLHGWPAGETRTFHNLRWYSYSSANDELCIVELQKALHGGYIETGRGDPADAHSKPGYVACRTAKPITLYTPRGADPEYAKKNPFPWSVDAHWEKVQKSKARAVRGIAKKLGVDDGELKYRYPELVHTKAELLSTRKELLGEFGNGVKRQWGPPRTIASAITGEQIHLLFMELLIQPQFDARGKFLRFVPVDQHFAFEERERITGATNDMLERYTKYLSGLHTAQLSTAA